MNKLQNQLLRPLNLPTRSTTARRLLSSTIDHQQLLFNYAAAFRSNTSLQDPYTYPSLLKACTSLKLYSPGLSLHQQIVVNGFSSDLYISTSLIDFYSKFKDIHSAQKLFDLMPERGIVPWTALIGCYSRSNDIKGAIFMYISMQFEGLKPSSVTFLALLSGILEGVLLDSLHCCVIKYGYVHDLVLMNCFLSVYGKCGRVEEARKLFELIEVKDTVSWNSLINGYGLIGDSKEILRLMHRMRVEGTAEPNQQVFGSLVMAVAKEGRVGTGKIVHGQILRAGCGLSEHIATSLVVMYLKCGNVGDASRIFDRSSHKDMVLWTAMISGLVQNECADKALVLFRRMLVSGVMPSTETLASVLAACAQMGSLKLGASVHCYLLRQRMAMDVATQNSLITMYAKCEHLDESFAVFNMMIERDVVSWNAIVAACAQSGHLSNAFCLFNDMRSDFQRPDSVTVVSLLQACASIGAYEQGKCLHNFVVRSCLDESVMIDTALVDMYSKCGNLIAARKCFDRMTQPDIISWTAIIAGYGSHGKGKTALEMYSKFQETGIEPNHVILLSVLSACSHNGLVAQGISLFKSISKAFRTKLKLEHYACIVDLLCRAGRVKDAYNFYKREFAEPSPDVLGILLDACRLKANKDLGDIIAREISILEPADAGRYVQLAHSFASMGKWDGVGDAWMKMRSLGLKKLPGWSFIELHGTITTFFMGQRSHHHYEDILLVLKCLSKDMRISTLDPIQEDFVMDSEII